MVVCAVTCEPVSTSHSLLFPVICIFSGKESLPFAVGSGALYVSPRKLRRLLALGDLPAASNQRKCCPLTGWKRFHNRGKFCPNSEPALCHRPKTAALRPTIIASPLSRTNSAAQRAKTRLYSLFSWSPIRIAGRALLELVRDRGLAIVVGRSAAVFGRWHSAGSLFGQKFPLLSNPFHPLTVHHLPRFHPPPQPP